MGKTYDVVCVGGGVIGLLTAHELSARKVSVAVLDKGALGTEASWAGAGIVPPASFDRPGSAFDRLRGFSFEQFPKLAQELLDQTGIDVGFQRTGGLELVLSTLDEQHLRAACASWAEQRVTCESKNPDEIAELEPDLAPVGRGGFWFPDMCQVRNPRLLRALIHACGQRGVELRPEREVSDFVRGNERIDAVRLANGETIACGHVAVTAGAWSARLLDQIGFQVPVYPVQGQIVALQTRGHLVRHIILAGKRYLVPRDDGLVLAGSTEDDVGFDKHVTAEGLAGLRDFAIGLYPPLRRAPVTANWAGLRPANRLSSPIIGRVPGWSNLWVATGHFRQGLQLSPGTARLLADWIGGSESFVPRDSFAVGADRTGHSSGFRS